MLAHLTLICCAVRPRSFHRHPAPISPCSIPVTFAAGVRSTHASEAVFAAEICLEYVSPESAGPLLSADSPVATPRGTNQAVLGRHAVLPVEVHVQPSLQVAAVQFREIYLPAGAGAAAAANGAAGGEASGEAAGTAGAVDNAAEEAPDASGEGSSGSSATFERRCVMEVAVANHGRWPLQVGSSPGWGWEHWQPAGLMLRAALQSHDGEHAATRLAPPVSRILPPQTLQVWLGRAISDPTHLAAAAERDLLLPPQLPPAAEGLPASGLLAPGRRCTVAYILDDAACSNGSQAGSGTLGAAPGGSSVPVARLAASFEEQQRQECAERLCRAVGLFYRVDADDAGIAGVCMCVCFLWEAVGTVSLPHSSSVTHISIRKEGSMEQSLMPLNANGLNMCKVCRAHLRPPSPAPAFGPSTECPPLLLPPSKPDAALGTAPLAHGEVFAGLTYRSLALLQPCAITVRLAAEPLPPGAAGSGSGSTTGEQRQGPALQLLAAPEAEQQQAAAAYSRFPAFSAALGQPLCVTLSVTNHGRTVPGAGKSPRSSTAGDGSSSDAPAAAAAAAEALELHLDASVACQPVRGSEQEEAAAAAASHELSAVWAGQLWTGLHLVVPPGQTVTQRLGLCLLAPGLYQIGLQHWQCRTAAQVAAAAAAAQAAGAGGGGQQQEQQQQQSKKKSRAPPGPLQNTMVAVEPCFVLAVAAGQQ